LSENNFQQVADMSRLQWRSIFLFILSLYFCQSAFASVVMTGSRVIYPSDAKSVDLKLRNDDDFPYVIQAWFDSKEIPPYA
jgi:fimbrial chaperone protein